MDSSSGGTSSNQFAIVSRSPFSRFLSPFTSSQMSSLVSALDTALSRVADLADNPSIDYKQLVVVSSWAVAAFEVWLL